MVIPPSHRSVLPDADQKAAGSGPTGMPSGLRSGTGVGGLGFRVPNSTKGGVF